MVSVRRNRAGVLLGSDSSVRRNSRALPCSVRRNYGGAPCSARRTKDRVFSVGAAPETLDSAHVVAGQSVQRVPSHSVPAGLVRPLPLYGFMDESGSQQLVLGALDHVGGFPAPRRQVRAARQQTAVVVPDILAGQLHQQTARRMTQTGVGGAIENVPGQRHKAAGHTA